ncbi:NAD-dependent dehydratase [Flavobacterium album]|uniref:NAD-dependent dehydratase n=1 Tax=Flavobacterium album TaxID=2175091 RepID=A0A2S1R1C5_9FLAO|nr:NAD(P)H-binding protein [Flavobacterium album]AWH86412.1 NAD-dependent dehydratase [Flavobacterium album]
MKIAITGSLGNVARPLVKQLLSEGHQLNVISSHDERKNDIEALGATAAIGPITDTSFLAEAFSGADAVFAMTPPSLALQNVVAANTAAGKAIVDAVKQANVKRVVLLSSIGAELDGGTGPIAALNAIENAYNKLENVTVTFLRAGYFYINFNNSIPMIQHSGILGSNLAADTPVPLVHPRDIATAAAGELTRGNAESGVRYIVSDVKTPAEITAAFGNAIGKPGLPWVTFSDEDNEQGMVQAGVPAEIAALYTEMGRGLREGSIQADFLNGGHSVDGKIKLEDFAKEFASAF